MSQKNSREKHFNFRHKGKKFNRENHRSNQFQRNGPKSIRPKAEQLTEQDVGITEYISKEAGFSGIIKARFSDFHVNEIDCTGTVAKLTNTDVPQNFNQGLDFIILLKTVLKIMFIFLRLYC